MPTATVGQVTVTPQRGLVRRPATAEAFSTRRYPAGEALAPWIAYFWTVGWDRGDAGPLESTVISFPSMHLTVEWGEPGAVRHGHPMPATLVHGLISRVFRVTLTGRGGVVGARFRADGFHAWTGLEAAAFTDRVVPAGDLLGPAVGALHLGSGPDTDPAEQLTRLRTELERTRPATVPAGVGPVVDLMATDPGLVRVDQVARSVALSERTLQRRFRREVGIGPKWVLSRFRLQEAALALERDPAVDLAVLAPRLGFYDQAHLTNTFVEMLGETPAAYAARAAATPSTTSPTAARGLGAGSGAGR
ncbi:helix-turn-helix domain-containing protein [Microlunatus aurantiacus]|uniref:Helix-turn-helix domain-containing protein n=1 Tax=Microlunatus aurantiacus TaxID=446786 RepID=A0ABP7E7R1_9ACTN